jgi:hypothetical protein
MKPIGLPLHVYERLVKRAHSRQPIGGVIEDLLDMVDMIEGKPNKDNNIKIKSGE